MTTNIRIQIKNTDASLEPVDEVLKCPPHTVITVDHKNSHFHVSRLGEAGQSYDLNDNDEITLTLMP